MSFINAKLWQNILSRIGSLETLIGQQPTPVDYNNASDLRAETIYNDEDRAFVLDVASVFIFDAESTATDDGILILIPDDITAPAPGRWLRENELALKSHTHDIYFSKIVTPVTNRFLVINSEGDIVETGFSQNSFAAANHTHSTYATKDQLATLAGAVDDLASQVNNVAQKPTLSEEQINKLAILDTDGNAQPTTKDPANVPTDEEKQALAGTGTPNTANPYVTKDTFDGELFSKQDKLTQVVVDWDGGDDTVFINGGYLNMNGSRKITLKMFLKELPNTPSQIIVHSQEGISHLLLIQFNNSTMYVYCKEGVANVGSVDFSTLDVVSDVLEIEIYTNAGGVNAILVNGSVESTITQLTAPNSSNIRYFGGSNEDVLFWDFKIWDITTGEDLIHWFKGDGALNLNWNDVASVLFGTVSGNPATITIGGSPGSLVVIDADGTLRASNKTEDDVGTGGTGGDTEQVHVPMRKSTTGTIAKGQPVYLVSYNPAGFIEVEESDASDPAKMPAFALAEVNLTNAVTGFGVILGKLADYDTSAWAVKTELYVDAGGGLSNTRPTGTNLVQKIAQVTRSNSVTGAVEVFGAGRSNALPNLPQGKIWIGNVDGLPVVHDLYRRNSSESANGTDNQIILYSSTFKNIKPILFDYEGLGIQLVSWNENGFTINSYASGKFGYEVKDNV